MNKKQTTFSNFVYNMLYEISLVVFPLITLPYLSRVVGSYSLGTYSYAHSIAYYFYLFSMLGINNYGTRSIAKCCGDKTKTNKIFSSIFYFKMIVSLLSLSLYIGYCFIFCKESIWLPFSLALYVFSAFFDINWLLFGLEEFKLTSIIKIVSRLFSTILIFLFVKSPDDVIVYSIILSSFELVSSLFVWLFLPKKAKFIKVDFKSIFACSKEIFVLFIPIVATSIYRYMDKIMIGNMASMFDVGQYDYAEKIIMICLGFLTAVGNVMLPKMSYLFEKKDYSQINKLIGISTKIVFLISFALTFGVAFVGKEAAVLFFGNEYEKCGTLLSALAITIIPISWANIIRTQFLIPSKNDFPYVLAVVIGAVINFICNLVFIRLYGVFGALVGTIVSEFVVALIQSAFVAPKIPVFKFISYGFPYLIIGFLMFRLLDIFNSFLIGSGFAKLGLHVLFGGLVYISLSGVYIFLFKDELLPFVKTRFKKPINRL